MSQSASSHPDRIVDRKDIHVLVGWTHNDMPNGINLRVRSTTSVVALQNEQISSHHLVMTNNQALLLARYLLSATGQTLAREEPPRGFWARLWRRLNC